MKKIKSAIFVFSYLFILCQNGNGQILSESFNTGLPANWTALPASTWSAGAGLGSSGSACIISQEPGSASVTTSVYTPSVSLSGMSTFTVSFKAAVVANNFVGPNIVLSYDAGNGPQFLARWGSGFSTNTTYTLMYSSDYTPPLEAQNMSLTVCTHTFALAFVPKVKFVFDAEFVNGGYTVVEDVVVLGKPDLTTGVEEINQSEEFVVFPNPSLNKNISIRGKNLRNITLCDQLGRKLDLVSKKQNEEQVELDLSGLPGGIYYLSALTSENKLVQKKIVVH